MELGAKGGKFCSFVCICYWEVLSDCSQKAGLSYCSCALHQIAVATTTSVELHVLLLWIYYHRRLGVDTFYIFVEGELESPEKRSILRSIPVSMLQSILLYISFYAFPGRILLCLSSTIDCAGREGELPYHEVARKAAKKVDDSSGSQWLTNSIKYINFQYWLFTVNWWSKVSLGLGDPNDRSWLRLELL